MAKYLQKTLVQAIQWDGDMAKIVKLIGKELPFSKLAGSENSLIIKDLRLGWQQVCHLGDYLLLYPNGTVDALEKSHFEKEWARNE